MNLVSCYKDCKYQQDGYCYLNEKAKPNDKSDSPCSYYKQKKSEETTFFNF